jgi:hypothetical protein
VNDAIYLGYLLWMNEIEEEEVEGLALRRAGRSRDVDSAEWKRAFGRRGYDSNAGKKVAAIRHGKVS